MRAIHIDPMEIPVTISYRGMLTISELARKTEPIVTGRPSDANAVPFFGGFYMLLDACNTMSGDELIAFIVSKFEKNTGTEQCLTEASS